MAKVPPPPNIANLDPAFNRWLLELTAVLNASGSINPASVPGLSATIAQTAQNTTDIAALQTGSGGQSSDITALRADVTTLQGQVVTINSSITTLAARNQVYNGIGVPGAGLGIDGDWYANTDPTAGTKAVYVKVTGTWTRITAFL